METYKQTISEKYYLYRHIRLDKNEPFYIGIGEKKIKKKGYTSYQDEYSRAFDKNQRNRFWHFIVDKTKYEVEILLEANSIQDICDKEIEFIKLYGRRDLGLGPLVNLTDGGNTTSGFRYTKEQIEKLKENRKNCKKGRESNKSKKFYQYDLEGNFIKECRNIRETSKELGLKYSNIQGALRKAKGVKSSAGFQWTYDYRGEKIKPVNRIRCSRDIIMIDKKTKQIKNNFKSISEAAIFVDGNTGNISNCLQNKRKSAFGYIWKFK